MKGFRAGELWPKKRDGAWEGPGWLAKSSVSPSLSCGMFFSLLGLDYYGVLLVQYVPAQHPTNWSEEKQPDRASLLCLRY